jgi:hypothetical protein
MLRIVPAFIGLGLTSLWIVGLSTDATVWLTWLVGIAAMLCFATVGFIPARRGSLLAAFGLGLLATGLLAAWIVGLRFAATPWLTWWAFAASLVTGLAAIGAAVQGAIDGVRARPTI